MITKITNPEVIKGHIVTYAKWEGESDYDLTIKIDVTTGKLSKQSNCGCEYRSFYGQSKANRKRWLCRHILHAYAKTIKQSPKKAREILIKHEIMSKDHLRWI